VAAFDESVVASEPLRGSVVTATPTGIIVIVTVTGTVDPGATALRLTEPTARCAP